MFIYSVKKNTPLITTTVIILLGCARMAIWPGENDLKAIRKTGEGENNKGQVTCQIFKLCIAEKYTKCAYNPY